MFKLCPNTHCNYSPPLLNILDLLSSNPSLLLLNPFVSASLTSNPENPSDTFSFTFKITCLSNTCENTGAFAALTTVHGILTDNHLHPVFRIYFLILLLLLVYTTYSVIYHILVYLLDCLHIQALRTELRRLHHHQHQHLWHVPQLQWRWHPVHWAKGLALQSL